MERFTRQGLGAVEVRTSTPAMWLRVGVGACCLVFGLAAGVAMYSIAGPLVPLAFITGFFVGAFFVGVIR